MGSTYPRSLISTSIITGLFLMCFHTTSAVKIQNFTLFGEKMVLKAHTRNIIPCMFHTRHLLKPRIVQMEWGKIPAGTLDYTPLLRLYGDHVKLASSDLGAKYQIFPSLVPRGNCSMVINSMDATDSGTYQVRLTVKGILYEPIPSIRIQVVTQQQAIPQKGPRKVKAKVKKKEEPMTTTQITLTTAANESDFISVYILPKLQGNERTALITVIAVGAFLLIFSLIGIDVWILYCRHRKKTHHGDVFNSMYEEETSSEQEEEELSEEEEEQEEENEDR
ncbi:hypothetical protein XELAEV_18030752mg [Xenopus laevis]|uniref:Immunoglobulin subtype domain-containing protein n=1 Tax=Xenopus laevis TaxID=8355 RepID=A0A974CMW3_XENLA|nr:hypothetical protein XELAEV_18030752mg [Xenopus laevis]